MRMIDNNKLNLELLKNCLSKPELYEKSTAKFWDDDYISSQMLRFHLNPDVESASKTKDTIEAETAFIIQATAMDENKAVIDLGCGPGIYVNEFAKTGARVTGMDLSGRSIDYANKTVQSAHGNTLFIKMNYLDMAFKKCFDIATLIFYDFCVLSATEQNKLLANIHAALKDDGFFLFDVVTQNMEMPVSGRVSTCDGGFWSPTPYVEILNSYMYENPMTNGQQYAIIEEDGSTRIIRLYHRLFALDEITQMLHANGFKIEQVYKNLQGEALTVDSPTYGIIARKA